MKDILVIIPARKGSKGIPDKNKKLLGDIPLIGHTILAALEVFDRKNICISTDDLEIISYAESLGLDVPFVRPDELSTDKSSAGDVIHHAIEWYHKIGFYPKSIVYLQPTSPFRNVHHIKEAIELYHNDLDMVVSVKETDANPYFVLFEENEKGFLEKSKSGNFARRQDVPTVWQYNGAIYVINVESLKKNSISNFSRIIKYEMDIFSSVDIDNTLDWLVAETLNKNPQYFE